MNMADRSLRSILSLEIDADTAMVSVSSNLFETIFGRGVERRDFYFLEVVGSSSTVVDES